MRSNREVSQQAGSATIGRRFALTIINGERRFSQPRSKVMSHPPSDLILASNSPRRRQLLADAGYRFDVIPPDDSAETGLCDRETPSELVARLARQKAANVASRTAQGLILGADTVAECGGTILGKPAGEDDARRMITMLRGREHRVYSGVCLWRRPEDHVIVRVAISTLQMDGVTDQQLEDYLATDAWRGKAGAFGYQDDHDWLHLSDGSKSNVVGLPMELLAQMIDEMTNAE